jgi:ArsR family transcriptional regulator
LRLCWLPFVAAVAAADAVFASSPAKHQRRVIRKERDEMRAPTLDRHQAQRIAKALADPTRATILERITSCDEAACATLREKTGLTAATMSHHLRELEGAGLIETRKGGQFLYARVRPGAMASYPRHLRERFG